MKPKTILRQELSQGRCVRLVVDHNGASMRGIINRGDVLTLGLSLTWLKFVWATWCMRGGRTATTSLLEEQLRLGVAFCV